MTALHRFLVSALIAASALPAAGMGYGQFDAALDGIASRWQTLPVEVIVDGGTLFGNSNGLALVQQAVDAWNSVDGVPQLMLRPPAQSADDFALANFASWDVDDGKIRVVFDEGGEIFSAVGLDPAGGVLGLGSTTAAVSTGAALGGIVLINGHASVSGSGDLLGTIVHEFGHVLGLTHTPVGFGGLAPLPNSKRPTMYPFSTGFDAGTLEPDDAAGIRAIYGP
ncbi:MAG: hypothetical protein FD165_1868 [Gammaproteobacteria bacterium]|nr:MAG: hypothetical protein FD165_1868 [Gammaproteobacteria bacterium]TND04441.1 MAG: hypothetical protein FD120_1555 [Gammaproteobacteria bacterium]